MKIFAGSQVAGEMRGGGAEWVVPRIEPTSGDVQRDVQRGVTRAMLFQLAPTAGGKRHSIAVVNAPARNLPSQRVDPGIVLRALDVVLLESVRVASQILRIVEDLVPEC